LPRQARDKQNANSKSLRILPWCFRIAGEAQALLFSSKNMVDWRFVSVFFLNSRADDSLPPDAGQGDAIMTPDTFTFPTGEQAFIYLGKQNTRWVTGTATRKNGELSEFVEQGFGGNPTTGEKETRLFVRSMFLLRGIFA
jgi:hypothetical protein